MSVRTSRTLVGLLGLVGVLSLAAAWIQVGLFRGFNGFGDQGAAVASTASFTALRTVVASAVLLLVVAGAVLAVQHRRVDGLVAGLLAVATGAAFLATPVPVRGSTIAYLLVPGGVVFPSLLVAAGGSSAVAIASAVVAVRAWRVPRSA